MMQTRLFRLFKSLQAISDRVTHVAVVALTFAVLNATPQSARAASDNDAINKMMERGRQFLVSQQRNGNWEDPANGQVEKTPTGFTALACIALKHSGEPVEGPVLKPALTYLFATPAEKVYALAVRLQLWNELPNTKPVADARRRDTRALLSGVNPRPPTVGLFGYSIQQGGGKTVHISTSNYGVLGLWSAAEAGESIPPQFWGSVEQAWIRGQLPEGGWSYSYPPAPFAEVRGRNDLIALPSMTAAGLATLLICQDYIGVTGKGSRISETAVAKATTWLDANFAKVFELTAYDNFAGQLYTLHNLERIGAASGLRYIGSKDWFAIGVEYLARTQLADGSWDGLGGKINNTSFALMFLSHANARPAFVKLDYTPPGAQEPVTWSENPRDIAALTRWASRATERRLRWEIVNSKTSLDELLASRVMVITGSKAMELTPELTTRIRDFALNGGLVLGVPTTDAGFAQSFKTLGESIFTGYSFRDLKPEHPIFTQQQFKAGLKKPLTKVTGLSNGARELMLLMPNTNISRNWARRSLVATGGTYQLGTNIYLYAGDPSPTVPAQAAAASFQTMLVGRLKHAGNFNAEPAAFTGKILSQSKYQWATQDIDLTADLKPFALLHLAGTDNVNFTDADIATLRKYVDDGGTVLIESIGAAPAFTASAEELMQRIKKPDETLTKLLAADPLFNSPNNTAPLRFRSGLADLLVRPRFSVLNINGRVAVAFTPADFSSTLAGACTNDYASWDAPSAVRILDTFCKRP